MNPASYDIRVDWSGDGSFAEVGDDISTRVFDRGTPLTLQYGRDQARAFAPLSGGRGQFELDNTSRDYSPENTSSPLVGKLLPGRDVRIEATLGLNANPFFETTVSPWTATGGTFVRSTSQFHEGVASGLLTPDGVTAAVSARAELVPAVVGIVYRASMWVRCASARNVNIGIRWYTAGAVFIFADSAEQFVDANTWTLLDFTATAPASTGQAQITTSMVGTPPITDLLHVDEAQLAIPAGLFRGNMDGFTVLPAIEQQSVQVTLLDALSRLKTQRVTTVLYSGLRTGAAIGLLLDAVGWTAGRDLDPGASTLPWWWADDAEAFTLLQAILDAEGPGCLATVGADGSFIFRDRHHRLLRAASTTVQATLRSDGVEPCYSDLEYDQGWSDIVNSVGFSIPIRAPSGELSQVWQMSGQRSIADVETVLLSASSSTPFFGAVVPAAGTDFTVLSGTVTVVLAASGASATVLVTAVGGPAVIDGMALRAYPIVTQATVQVTAEDSTSIARYGRRSWQSGRDPDLASLPDALAIADIILAHRADRLPTVTITLKGGVSERMVQQLSRDLSDRVHITDAGSGLDADCWVEQIAHTAANGDHVTVFGCEKIPTPPTGLLVLDDAAAGLLDTGKLGGIGLSSPTTVFILDDAAQGKLGTVTALLGV